MFQTSLAHRTIFTAAAVALISLGLPAAAAQATESTRYVALGDSVSSGRGAPPFDLAGDLCDRTSNSYPALFAAQHHVTDFTFVACSGATTTDVLATQVNALSAATTLVTVSIGANDVGFSPIVESCTGAPPTPAGDSTCLKAVDQGEAAAVTALPLRLLRTYASIRRHAPHARVVVLGYERLFETNTSKCPDPFTPDLVRRVKLNQGADLLDGVIRTAGLGFGFTFVDVRAAFAGHGICAPLDTTWVNGPSTSFDVGPYHPNAVGYRDGYLPALDSAPARS